MQCFHFWPWSTIYHPISPNIHLTDCKLSPDHTTASRYTGSMFLRNSQRGFCVPSFAPAWLDTEASMVPTLTFLSLAIMLLSWFQSYKSFAHSIASYHVGIEESYVFALLCQSLLIICQWFKIGPFVFPPYHSRLLSSLLWLYIE